MLTDGVPVPGVDGVVEGGVGETVDPGTRVPVDAPSPGDGEAVVLVAVVVGVGWGAPAQETMARTAIVARPTRTINIFRFTMSHPSNSIRTDYNGEFNAYVS